MLLQYIFIVFQQKEI